MSAIGFMTLLNKEDSVLSPHFGMAKWLMIVDKDTGKSTFVRNEHLNGRSVVDLLIANRCSDVVFNEIGFGALRHLQNAKIGAWFAPADAPVPQLLEMFRQGKLEKAREPREGHAQHGNGGHCCGQKSAPESAWTSNHRNRCCGH